MDYLTTSLKNVVLIKPKVFADERGFFFETWTQKFFDQTLNNNQPLIFVQDNHSASVQHVLRGLHFQYRHPQGKLVRVTQGSVYDVIVDLRLNSPTFGQWESFNLSSENKHMLWIPPGFAHGFYTISEQAEICYKCTDYYYPDDDYSILWNDPDLAIDWPLVSNSPPKLSLKDSQGVNFAKALKYA